MTSPASFPRAAAPVSPVRSEAGALLALAAPMGIAQMAQVATGFVNTVMAGRVSPSDLAAVSIGASVWMTVFLTLSGVVGALNPIIAHHLGGKAVERIGPEVRQGVWMGAALGLAGMALLLWLRPWLAVWLSLDPAVALKVDGYLTGAALGMPAMLLYRVLHAYTSSVSQTRPIMLVSLGALGLNIPLNYILIHGLFGLPAMGGAGCGWASGLVFWISLLVLALHTRRAGVYRDYSVWQRLERPDWAAQRQLLRLGVPIALSIFMEVSSFTFIALLLAPLGTTMVAGHQVVLNFSGLLYMIPQCLATALTVRVGQALGAGAPDEAHLRSRVGMMLGLGFAVVCAAGMLLGRDLIPRFYSADAQVVALAASLLTLAAAFQLSDAVQLIATGALRGYRVTTRPMLVHVVTFWGIGLAGGAWLGLGHGEVWGYTRPLGAHGFWLALTASLTLAALLLGGLLAWVARRPPVMPVRAATEAG